MGVRVRLSHCVRPLSVAAALCLWGCDISNQPIDMRWVESNVFLTSYGEAPKHLDSASSYSNNETPWTYAIYEPPLRYHYLKRPYVLEPRTLTALPRVRYLDAQGKPLGASAPTSRIAQTVFELKVQPGILFAPHPAFARDSSGHLLYHQLREDDLRSIKKPSDFAEQGSRELTAADYIYAIKRLASPRVKSPVFGFLSEKIVGLAELGKQTRQVNDEIKSKLSPREAGPFGHLPWMDFREFDLKGVELVDTHTFRIHVKGKYPQFKYWLAMTFFSPVAWEVDAFYAQPGMSQKNLKPDSWPVGTGPFMLTENIPNARMVLSRNPHYRGGTYPCEGEPEDERKGLLADCGKRTPFVDGMVSILDKEGSSVFTKFIQGYYDTPQIERGESGIAFQVAIDDNTGRARDLVARKIQLPSTIQVGFSYFGFNWLDPVVGAGNTPEQKTKNRKLRQAIAIAFDFEEYVAIFEDNRAQVNHSAVVAGLFGHDTIKPNPVTHIMGPDGRARRRPIEDAKRLLAEAGYPDGRHAKTGEPLVINYDTTGVGPAYKARLDWVTKQFSKLNIQVELRNTDYNRFQDKMRKGSAQFFSWGWLADYPDPENFLFLLYGPNAKAKGDGENASNWQNDEYDRLFDRMKDMEDTPERAALIRRMGEIMQEEMPLLFGTSDEYGSALHQWVSNGKPSNIIRDNLPYLRVNAHLRAQMVREWNQPIWWPLWLLPLGLLAVCIPAWLAWKKRQARTALEEVRA